MSIQNIKAVLLIEDFDLYPRSAVDSVHVGEIVNAIEAGYKMPPIIVDADSKRIVDGFHRVRAVIRMFGDEADIVADFRNYPSKKDMYLDAIRLNRGRGKDLNGAEMTGAILKGSEMKISIENLASVCGVTCERVKAIIGTKTVEIRGGHGKRTALHRSVHHMAGKIVTKKQAEIIESAPGQTMSLLLRQLNDLIENNLIDWEDVIVCQEFTRLETNMKSCQEKYLIKG